MNDQGTAVLLAAAGLSSRMGAFKPMIKLEGKPLIEHALDAFRTLDVKETVVVTGHRHEEIERHFAGRGIVFIRNEEYAATDMFHSIRMGLSRLSGKCGRVFVMPADIPLVRPFSIQTMLCRAAKLRAAVLKPAYRGKSGHPLLLDAEAIPQILAYDGEGGLKGALRARDLDVCLLPLPDPGILMDADTPENLKAIRRYYRNMDTPSRELALEILAWRGVGDDVTRHCIAVEKLAGILARRARMSGFSVDLSRVEAGALLHDVERQVGRDHARKGSALLLDMGYSGIADIVGAHMELPQGALERLDERAIVYLADKLICGNRRVTVQTRLEGALLKYGCSEEARSSIHKRMADARTILQRLGVDDADCL